MMDVYCFFGLVFAMVGLISTLYTCKALREIRPSSYKTNILFLYSICTFLFCLCAGIYLMLIRATLQDMKFPGIYEVIDLAIGMSFLVTVAIHICTFAIVVHELLSRIQLQYFRFTKPLLVILVIIGIMVLLSSMVACITSRNPHLTWVSEKPVCTAVNEGAILLTLFIISTIGSFKSVFGVSERSLPGLSSTYRGHVTRNPGYSGHPVRGGGCHSWGETISNRHATGGGSLIDPPEEEEEEEDDENVVTSYRIPLRHSNEVTNVFTSDPFLSHSLRDRIAAHHSRSSGSHLHEDSGESRNLSPLNEKAEEGRKISTQSRQSQTSMSKRQLETVSQFYKTVYMIVNLVLNASCLGCFFFGFHFSENESKLTATSVHFLTLAVTLNCFLSASSFLFCYLACLPEQRTHFFID